MSSEEARTLPSVDEGQPRRRLPALRRWQLAGAETAMLAGVLVLAAVVYLRCLANGFVSDDVIMIVKNRYIGQWSFLWKSMTRDLWWFNSKDLSHGVPTSWYQPVQNLWLGLGYHLFGTNPLGWHLAKIALLLVTVALVFRVAQLLSGSASVGLLAALLFALLPVHAEPVVWATDIPEPLSTAFELGAFCLFIQRGNRGWRGLAWPLVLYAFAVFTHESAVVFPALIAAYVFLFEQEGSNAAAPSELAEPVPVRARVGKSLAWAAPFLGVALVYLAVRAVVLGRARLFGLRMQLKHAALVHGKVVPRWTIVHHAVGQILLTIPSVLLWYLKLLLLPWTPGPAHPATFVSAPTLANFYAPLAFLLLLAVGGWIAFRNSPRARLYLFCSVWWLVALATAPLPAVKLSTSLVHDRYDYLASFAFCLLLADLVVRFARESASRRRVATVAVAALAALYAVMLWRVEPVWHDNISLFSRCVANFPDSAKYRMSLAGALMDRGNFKEAARQAAYASRLKPGDASVHFVLAAIDMHIGQKQAAMREFKLYYDKAFNNRGVVIVTPLPAANPNADAPAAKTDAPATKPDKQAKAPQ